MKKDGREKEMHMKNPYPMPGEEDIPPIEFPPESNPGILRPVNDPPVPNQAWTEMKLGHDIDELTEEEKRELYIGPDQLF